MKSKISTSEKCLDTFQVIFIVKLIDHFNYLQQYNEVSNMQFNIMQPKIIRL